MDPTTCGEVVIGGNETIVEAHWQGYLVLAVRIRANVNLTRSSPVQQDIGRLAYSILDWCLDSERGQPENMRPRSIVSATRRGRLQQS